MNDPFEALAAMKAALEEGLALLDGASMDDAAGLDALLVARGIHADDLVDTTGTLDGARIAARADETGVRLIGAVDAFVW